MLIWINKWDKGFKNGKSKICGRQPLKIWGDMVRWGRPEQFKFFKGCLSQILLGPFLNTLPQIIDMSNKFRFYLPQILTVIGFLVIIETVIIITLTQNVAAIAVAVSSDS